jgi:hypothetical protein
VIYEFAVDPDIVVKWAMDQDAAMVGQFGLDRRRLVADFPRNWEGYVQSRLLQKFDLDYGAPEFIEANGILTAYLDLMAEHMVSRSVDVGDDEWLAHATAEHAVRPFHAIVASNPPAGSADVIDESVMQRLNDTRWHLPTIKPARKTAGELASLLAPILGHANEILIVDPYFDAADASYRDVLRALVLRAIAGRNPARVWPKFVLITGVDDRKRGAGQIPQAQQNLNVANAKYGDAQRCLPNELPVGVEMACYCISGLIQGDRFHNRFVLSDFAGALCPYGVEELGEEVFDDITPLHQGQYEKRWAQFSRTAELPVVGRSVVIRGEQQ